MIPPRMPREGSQGYSDSQVRQMQLTQQRLTGLRRKTYTVPGTGTISNRRTLTGSLTVGQLEEVVATILRDLQENELIGEG